MGPLASEVSQDFLGPAAHQDHLDHLDHQDLQDSLAFLEKWEIMCVFFSVIIIKKLLVSTEIHQLLFDMRCSKRLGRPFVLAKQDFIGF